MPGTGLSCVTCSSPIAQPKITTTYTLQVSNPGNCSASQSITVEVICKDQQIFIPNTFSPNGDGVNDVFFPRGKGIYSIRSFRIFNRLGQVVFERTNLIANDAANGWDGKYQGKVLISDVYIYEMEVVCDNNQVIPFKGNITLIR
jgi:gliding motility-associated-like protein